MVAGVVVETRVASLHDPHGARAAVRVGHVELQVRLRGELGSHLARAASDVKQADDAGWGGAGWGRVGLACVRLDW